MQDSIQQTDWRYDLAKARALQRGFRGSDLDDAVQQAMSEIIQFKFDSTRSNGAQESTAIVEIIDRQLSKIRRGCGRHQKNLNKLKLFNTHSPDIGDVDLQIDIRAAIAGLKPRERHVCEELAAGKTITDIAQDQNCGWHTVNRIVIRIREHFESLGLAPMEISAVRKGAY